MSLWQDIQQGKKPFRPKLSARSVGLRLAFSLPFLLFGAYLIYRTAEARVSLQRDDDGTVSARVYRQYWGVPFAGRGINGVKQARVAEEMRMVEKHKFGGGSNSFQSHDHRPVSKVVLEGAEEGTDDLSVSEFRFDSVQINRDTARELNEFLRAESKRELTCAIPFEQSQIMPRLAILFLVGLGGFILMSLPIDVAIWWIQKRYRLKQQRT